MEQEIQTSQHWKASSSNVIDFPFGQTAGKARGVTKEAGAAAPTMADQIDLFRLMATGEHSAASLSGGDRRAPGRPRVVPRKRSELVNRAMNVTIAVLALVLLAPVMLLVALLVKLTSPGPVLYFQTRVGMDRRRRPTTAVFDRRASDVGGRTFSIIKFRSMRVDAEKGTGAVWAVKNDPRVTPVGRFLRKTRLDEVPQLFNVIKGDMNIVGPRPERPSIFAELRLNIQEYPLRQQTRPGLTGWAQINRAYDSSLDDVRAKVQFDLEYLQRQSFLEDIKIMARTLPVMIFNKGAC